MATHGAYTVSVDVYDLIYGFLDYAGQADEIVAEVVSRRGPVSSLLEVGCGTGAFLVEFARHVDDLVGVDISEPMLAAAAEKLPAVSLSVGDMRSFSLGRRFDVVACLFSSIGYMTTDADLRAALTTMRDHLEPGGALVVDPWLERDGFITGHVGGNWETDDGVVVARLSYGNRRGNVSVLDMHHLVGRRGEGVTHYVERHEMGLFDRAEILAILDDLGFDVEVVDAPWQDRYRLIGVLR